MGGHDGRILRQRVLDRPSERPLAGTVRHLVYASVAAIILIVWESIGTGFRWSFIPGYLLAGIGVSFMGWGAERLWLSAIAPMMRDGLAWYSYLTRLPFWIMAGGIGYVVGMLSARKFGWIDVWDIPVRGIFVIGAMIGVALQIPLQVRLYRQSAQPQPVPLGERSG